MAKAIKEAKKKSKLIEILTKEYKWENLILAVFVLAGIVISTLILSSVLTIDPNFPVLGNPTVGKIFSIVLLIISILGLLLVLYPFISPSLPELRKITWPNKSKYFKTLAQVLAFIIIVTVILFLFDLAGTSVIKLINEWRNNG
jgi:preprotein translocase subunit SecE